VEGETSIMAGDSSQWVGGGDLVVLIVDDKPDNLDAESRLFRDSGFRAITATNVEQAQYQLSTTPAIDLLVTDVNLNPQHRQYSNDKSGLQFAASVHARHPSLPIVVYSGQFDKDQLKSAEVSDAIELIPREFYSHEVWSERLERLRGRAEEYRVSRAKGAREALEIMRQKYRMSDVDVEVIRTFMPGAGDDAPHSAETILRDLGYTLQIVGAGFTARVDEGGEAVTCEPFLLWMRQIENGVVAQLFGHEEIYGDGRSAVEAQTNTLLLMHGFYNDLEASPPAEDEPALRELARTLRRVFGRARSAQR
jgi:CheY-like chemotaxis protein